MLVTILLKLPTQGADNPKHYLKGYKNLVSNQVFENFIAKQ